MDGVHLVPVGAPEGDRVAVDAHQPVLERELAQADPVGDGLGHPPRRVAQPEHGGVEVRVLGRPQARRGHRLRRLDGRLLAGADGDGLLERPGPHRMPVRVVELGLDGVAARALSAVVPHARGDRQGGRPVAVGQRGVESEVAQVDGRCGVQVDRAEDAAQPDHVLVLQPVAVGVAVDLHGDLVGARLEVRGDVVLGGVVGVLVVADQLPVDPYVVGGLDAFEVQERPPPRPAARKREGAAVLAHGVVAGGGVRRLRLLAQAVGAPPRVVAVDVDRAVVTVQLPGRGDGEGVPAAVVEVGAVEVGVAVVGAVCVGELPGAVEAQPVRGAGAVGGEGLGEVRVRHEGGVRGLGAEPEDVDRAVPLRLSRGAVRRDGPVGGGRGGQGDRAEGGGRPLEQTASADGRPPLVVRLHPLGAVRPVHGRHVRVRHDHDLPRGDRAAVHGRRVRQILSTPVEKTNIDAPY